MTATVRVGNSVGQGGHGNSKSSEAEMAWSKVETVWSEAEMVWIKAKMTARSEQG